MSNHYSRIVTVKLRLWGEPCEKAFGVPYVVLHVRVRLFVTHHGLVVLFVFVFSLFYINERSPSKQIVLVSPLKGNLSLTIYYLVSDKEKYIFGIVQCLASARMNKLTCALHCGQGWPPLRWPMRRDLRGTLSRRIVKCGGPGAIPAPLK